MSVTTVPPPASELNRDELTITDNVGDEHDVRLYFHETLEKPLPSVTSVTDFRIDPEKKEAIDGWKEHFDGSTEYKSPHWEEQKKYKGWRGTLGHFAILSQLDDSLEKTDEEKEAEDALQSYGEYDGADDAWDKCMRDINWAITQFKTNESVPDITPENTIAVEEYVYDDDIGYAGQFDLLYEADDGATVLCDLKLASGIRIDYKLQLAAYAAACEQDIDRVQVIRLYPDKEEVEVEDNRDWDRTVRGLKHQFYGLCDVVHAGVDTTQAELSD